MRGYNEIFYLIFFCVLLFGFIIYKIGAFLKSPKTGIILVVIYALLLFISLFGRKISESLFMKSDLRKFLNKQGFILKEDFQIMRNTKQIQFNGSTNHEIDLILSKGDIETIIHEIKSANNFSIKKKMNYGYFNVSTISNANYQVNTLFVREYKKLNSRNSMTYGRITVHKDNRGINYEIINE